MEKRKALLLGATGLVGSTCLDLLLEDGRYSRVWVLGRREPEQKHDKLSTAIVNLENTPAEDLPREPLEVDDVFCALGTTRRKAGSKQRFARIDFGIPLEVARAAREAGAKRFVLVSAVGADSGSLSHYMRVKGDLESALEEIGFDALHILRPSMLDGDRVEKRLGEDMGLVVGRAVAPLMRGPLERYRPIQAQIVARAMLAAANSDKGGTRIWESERLPSLSQQI